MDVTTIPVPALEQVTSSIFVALGASRQTADEVAAALVGSDLAGHPSHGVVRLPMYADMIRSGALDPQAETRIVVDRGPVALMSGDWGFGHVIGSRATDEGIARARTHGLSAIGLLRCNHLGRLGAFIEQAAEAGCVALIWVGGLRGAHQAVPHGGSRSVFGANPLAAGFPVEGSHPIIVDFATTAVAGGKVLLAEKANESVPLGWIVDAEGRPSTDPKDLDRGGALVPFGGHKGYGLAVLVEALGYALTGAATTAEEPGGGPIFGSSGCLLVVISGDAFQPLEDTLRGGAELVERLRATPPAPGYDQVLAPGDPEHVARERRPDEVALSNETWAEIVTIAGSLGVAT